MIGHYCGHFLDKSLASFARKVDLHPNTITIAGLVITAAASIVLYRSLFWGGILIIAGGLCDIFDGVAARVNGTSSTFGAFLDSVLDRYSDSFLFLGLTAYYYRVESEAGMILSLGTLMGAFMVSYTRARAEGLGRSCSVGIMERPERVILLALGALTGWMMFFLWVLFLLTHVTVIQRIRHVWKSVDPDREI